MKISLRTKGAFDLDFATLLIFEGMIFEKKNEKEKSKLAFKIAYTLASVHKEHPDAQKIMDEAIKHLRKWKFKKEEFIL